MSDVSTMRVNWTPDIARSEGYKAYHVPACFAPHNYDSFGVVYDHNSKGAALMRGDKF